MIDQKTADKFLATEKTLGWGAKSGLVKPVR
jgi:hypothetical protein